MSLFHPDGDKFVTQGSTYSIIMWDLSTRSKIKELKGHTGFVTSFDFTKDGKYLVSGSYDYSVRMWDVESEELLHTYRNGETTIYSAFYSANEQSIFSVNVNGVITEWNRVNGEITSTFGMEEYSSLYPFFFVLDDQSFLGAETIGSGGILWDLNLNQQTRTFPERPLAVSSNGSLFLSRVIDADGHFELTYSSHDRYETKIWDIQNGVAIHHFPDSGSPFQFIAADQRLITNRIVPETSYYDSYYDQLIPHYLTQVWDIQENSILHTFDGETLAITQDHQWIFTEVGNHPRIWNIETEEVIKHFPQQSFVRTTKAQFSPNKRYILLHRVYDDDFYVSEQWNELWDLETNEQVSNPLIGDNWIFTTDSQSVLYSRGNTVRKRDIVTGREIIYESVNGGRKVSEKSA